MIRTHDAGSLRASDAGTTVTLAGWVARRRDHGGVIFVDLRDALRRGPGGVPRGGRARAAQRVLRRWSPARSTARPEGNENPDLPTGAVEVVAGELTVLSEAAPLPLPVDDTITASDDLRLKYRYLDLRRSGPANALKLRSRANQIAREVLHARDFHEIETPTLTRSTPEGARDFLVPGAAAARHLVRAAAVAAAVQAAAHGRRHGALLPDRPLLPRRGLPRRPAARVHPARHRDVVRHPGRRHRRSARRSCRRLWGELAGYDVQTADPADHLARRDGPVRLRQARPALRRWS